LVATFAAMLLTAKLFSKSEAKQERQPKTDGPLETRTKPNPPAQTANSAIHPVAGPIPASASSSAD
jgi:hypothetical protein